MSIPTLCHRRPKRRPGDQGNGVTKLQTQRWPRRLVAPIGVLLLAAASAGPATAQGASVPAAPPVPPALQVPAGNVLLMRLHAVGTQNYVCLPESAANPYSYRWTFQGPQATLFLPGTTVPVGTHYLSAVTPPNIGGLPTWQDAVGSKVWGTKVAASTDPAFVDPTAIPWLLLKAVAHSGAGPMSQVSYIQRLDTTGGLGPGQLTNTQPPPETTTCATGTDVGKVAFVPYSADYFFYRATV